MKHFTKICLAVAVIFLIVGGVFCMVGISLGASLDTVRENVYFDTSTGRFVETTEDDGLTQSSRTFQNIRNLEIDVGQGAFTIREADVEAVQVTCSSKMGNMECRADGDTLTLLTHSVSVWNGSNAWVQVDVPKGTVFERIDLDCGVGEVTLNGLTCRELYIENGVGSVVFSGDVTKECVVEGGIGEVILNLKGSEQDFNYSLTCGIGEIQLGSSSYSGLGNSTDLDHDAEKELSVDCGIGSVCIVFEKEN
ncbi:MAG: hypothetical protein Q4F41_02700 [Eubacteriales bacterium]|nr:hypothetical protein [Eubacteriales bacterium]